MQRNASPYWPKNGNTEKTFHILSSNTFQDTFFLVVSVLPLLKHYYGSIMAGRWLYRAAPAIQRQQPESEQLTQKRMIQG